MTDRIDPATLTDPRDQAAYWYERIHSDDITETERVAFEQWRQADPENVRHYQQVEHIWAMAAALPKSEVCKLGTARRPAPVWRPSRRAFCGYGLGLTCAAALAVVIVDPLNWGAVPVYEAQFATAHGERRQIVLPDDSTLLLNTDTTISVALYKHQRIVRLAQGEVFFQVDGTRGTPFIVDTENATVRVTGTKFNVRHTGQESSVDVLEGSVEVQTGPWWNRQTALLQSGHMARTNLSGTMTLRRDADVDSVLAWREGKVVFRSTPLAEAVQELNRYSVQRMTVREPQPSQLRISGVFSVDDPDSFLAALPRIVPVTVQPRPDGTAVDILPR